MAAHSVVPFLRARRVLMSMLMAALGLAGVLAVTHLVGGAQLSDARPRLEFRVSPDEARQLTGFVIGYFPPGQPSPEFTFNVSRKEIESPEPGVMRIPLIPGYLPPGRVYEVRLRAAIGRQRSAWSEPSGTFTVPADAKMPASKPAAPARSAKEPASPSGRKAAASTRSAVTQLESNPAMAAKLSEQFPGIDVAQAAQGFRTVQDLGAALFAATNLKVPFADVKRLTGDAGSRNLQRAIAALKHDVNARAEAQRAQRQSRELLRPPAKKL